MKEDTSRHTVLSATDLAIGYKKNKVARHINFALNGGELTAIVGINGIGKSTLLRTMAHMQPPLSGSIEVDRKPLDTYTPQKLSSKISMVLTEPLASKNLSVAELVALGRQPYTNWIGTLTEDDRQKTEEALAALGLASIRKKKCYELSDGQLQRAMIARALAQDTAIILLDEPTTHLDLYHKVQILKLLKSIAHETQKTVVFTTHEIEMAIQLCDKMLLLNGTDNPFGQPCQLIEQGAFEAIFPDDTVTFDGETGTFRIKK
ncbi:ABC transporter ATP-binding protein [Pseudozobellia thermophila]|uniref:Iron complex transport system ATP-binding protein n=1 Tax=Pseudozobellia thermophila TaxID=192903 RepID=A0A1M6FG48_9FLAO|nr:ABC transporter ATP-binding protein [Pseudozobellia thermophila]SHI96698.1 iron complex transport system ATP-binding protein [Pseudozobellia thermophila]